MEGGSSGSRGKLQTEKLKAKIEEQLNRLVTQLEDLEEMKTDLDEEEYQETKQETLDQMREFQAFLEKTMAGDMTLINEFGSVQLAIQAAVSQAFQTPEVIKMFAKKQPQQLRQRLANLKRDAKLYKIPASAVTQQV
ncbi:SKA2 domain-containing protein, partial [Balamuthia mandrillaris]